MEQGAKVKGNQSIRPGTAIATFNSHGLYANNSTGNHAAIYIGQDAYGIWVYDQWVRQGSVQKRRIPFRGGGSPSNDGDASMLFNNWSQFTNPWQIVNLREFKILLIAAIMLCAANTVYAEENLCPKTVSVQQEITLLPSSWEAFPQELPYQLKSVSFLKATPKKESP